jgi:DNA-binding transcriptional LysR family regulator
VAGVRPNFFRLQTLLVAADCGSIAAAARRLNVTAPAVTKAIRQLEQEYDTVLLLRSRSGVSPTEAGLAVIRRARLALNELQHASDEVRELKGLGQGKITVGALAFARATLMPRALVKFTAARPTDDVAVWDGEFDALIALLREGKLDFIVGALREQALPAEITQDRLFDDAVVVAARRDHPLCQRTSVPLAELVRWRWVVPPADSPVRHLLDRSFADAGIDGPEHPIVTSSLEVMRGILLDSDRLGIVSRNRIFHELEYGLLVELGARLTHSKRPVGIIRRREAPPTAAVDEMVRCIRVVAAELRRARPRG